MVRRSSNGRRKDSDTEKMCLFERSRNYIPRYDTPKLSTIWEHDYREPWRLNSWSAASRHTVILPFMPPSSECGRDQRTVGKP